jgi:DNA-binding LacI/PurR family transcriptional regulator
MSGNNVTMKDVAEQAGVSISSVSHYVNDTRKVSEKTRLKIKSAIETLDFSPNSAAQMLRSGKSRMIGFVVSNLESSFYVRIAKGIEKVANQNGYDLVLVDSGENKAKERKNIRSLYARGIAGIVMVPITPDCEYLASLLPEGFPLVFVDRQANEPANTVLLDNERAGYQATQYFLRRGITDIAFIALSYGVAHIDRTMEDRIQGYRNAFVENGLPVDQRYIHCFPGAEQSPLGTMMYSEAYKCTELLLAETPVKAIVCGNSLAAIGVYSYLREHKVDIPRDISLLTFDNDLWLNLATPAISSVVQPAEEMGIAAARLLLGKIQSPGSPDQTVRLKSEIILRESC